MASKPKLYDHLLDDLPPDLALFVRHLRREFPEKYALGEDWDDPVLEDLDKLATESEPGARLRQHLDEMIARQEAEADEEMDRLLTAAWLLEKPMGNA